MKLTQAFYHRNTRLVAQALLGKYLSGSRTAFPWWCESRKPKPTLAGWTKPVTPTTTGEPPGRRPYSPHRHRLYLSHLWYVSLPEFCDRARGRALCRPDPGRSAPGKSFLSGPEPIWRRLGAAVCLSEKEFSQRAGKLCQALALTRAENGCSLLGDSLFVCDRLEDIGLTTPPEDLRPFSIVAGPRIGIDYAEEAVDFPWRYLIGP